MLGGFKRFPTDSDLAYADTLWKAADALRRKSDWTQRESVRASLRRNVRRLLARYGYPPDLAEGATQLILRQAELSTESSAC